MKRFAPLLLVSFLAACDFHAKNPAHHGDENVTINADESGHVNFNLPFANGSIKLPEGAMNNGHFDIDGVKMIQGGTITGFDVFARDKGSTVHLTFKAPQSADEVRSYFLDQFRQKGIKAAQSGNSVSGKSRDGNDFAIDVEAAGQGSAGRITIQDKGLN
jgi:hypothetical protein